MTITVELLQEEALALLRNLEKLRLIKLSLPNKKNGATTLSETLGSEPITSSIDTIKPIRANLTLEELLAENKFNGFDRQELDKLIAEIDIQDPIEELLSMLKP